MKNLISLVTAGLLLTGTSYAEDKSANAYALLGDLYSEMALQSAAPDRADKRDAQRAVEAYQKALALDPDLFSVKDPFTAFFNLARCQEALGQEERALNTLQKALRQDSASPLAYLHSARLRHNLKDDKGSAADFHAAVRQARRSEMYSALLILVKGESAFSELIELPENQLVLRSYEAVDKGTLSDEQARARVRSANGELLAMKADVAKDELRDAPGSASAIQALNEQLLPETADVASIQYQLAQEHSRRGELGKALGALHRSLGAARSAEELEKTKAWARADPALKTLLALPGYEGVLDSYSKKFTR